VTPSKVLPYARTSPLVSVIILGYNSRRFLDACLSSVFQTDYPNFEVVFVDNNSQDGSADFVSTTFGKNKITVLRLNHNSGFSVGNNFGASYAKGDYLMFLNPDTSVNPEWLKTLVEVLEANPTIAIVQPKLLQTERDLIDSTGAFINRFGLVWSRGSDEKDVGQYNTISRIFYAKGAAFMVSHKLWNDLQGFDPLFFTYFEETDLCWRAWKVGYSVSYVPNSVVYHWGGGSLRNVPFQTKFHEARGRLALLIKHYSYKEYFTRIPVLFLLYSANVVRQLLGRNKFSAIAIIKGTFWCLINFKRIWVTKSSFIEKVHFGGELTTLFEDVPRNIWN
jgi:GT2 family glycosyltransferase